MSNAPYRVLAIEGGGMRGYYAATLLDTLCRLFNGNSSVDWNKNLNLVCGTSTGAILACAIAKGIALQEVMEMYKKKGKMIFPPPSKNTALRLLRCIRNIHSHSSKEVHLRKSLEDIFGQQTLVDIYNEHEIALCIPAVNAGTYRSRVFKTPHTSGKTYDNNYKIVDICMASAAAPLLFSPVEVQHPDTNIKQRFVDGGLWANSPILIALIEALLVSKDDQDIHILSVGTASTPNGDPEVLRQPFWGMMQWGFGSKIMEMSISAQSYGYYSMANFLADKFSQYGREIKVIKLEETHKSPEKYSAIGIDRADDCAIDTLAQMAEADAFENHSKIMSRKENIEIKGFFMSTNLNQEKNHG